MQNLTIKQIAFLYLLIYNIGEIVDPENYNAELEVKCYEILKDNNCPTEIVFDYEGEPTVDWPSLPNGNDFDWQEWLFKTDLSEEEYDQPLLRDYIYDGLKKVLENPKTLGEIIKTID